MRNGRVLGSVIVITLALAAYAAFAADTTSGTWSVEVSGAIASTCTAEVQREGKSLTGTITCQQAGLRLPIRGRISGNGAVSTAGGDLGWTATQNGDGASGTYQGSIGAGSWIATRDN